MVTGNQVSSLLMRRIRQIVLEPPQSGIFMLGLGVTQLLENLNQKA